jgi:hypothetical protein
MSAAERLRADPRNTPGRSQPFSYLFSVTANAAFRRMPTLIHLQQLANMMLGRSIDDGRHRGGGAIVAVWSGQEPKADNAVLTTLLMRTARIAP